MRTLHTKSSKGTIEMAYAFTQDLPSNRAMYTSLSDRIGDEVPKGLIVHLAFETEKGMRIVDLWENEADFDRFRAERLGPALDKVLQEAGMTRESMGQPDEQEMQPVEIFGTAFPKKRFS